jgi:hypothetical protein
MASLPANSQASMNAAQYYILSVTETPQQRYQRESKGDADPINVAYQAAKRAAFEARGPAEIAARTDAIRNFEFKPSFGTQAEMDYVRNVGLARQEAARRLEETAMPPQRPKEITPEQRAVQRANEQFKLDSAERDRKYAAEQAAIKAAAKDAADPLKQHRQAVDQIRLEAEKPENKNDPEKMKKLAHYETLLLKMIGFGGKPPSKVGIKDPALLEQVQAARQRFFMTPATGALLSSPDPLKVSSLDPVTGMGTDRQQRIAEFRARRNSPEALNQLDAERQKLIATVATGSLPSSQALANSAALLNAGTKNESSAIDVALLTHNAMGGILANAVNDANAATRTLEATTGKKPLAKQVPKRPIKPKPPSRPKGRR